MNSINILSILIASLVNFAISSFWYSPLAFGDTWARLQSISTEEVSKRDNGRIWTKYLVHFITTVVSYIIMAFIITAAGSWTVGDGIFVAFIVWLGFLVTRSIQEFIWKDHSIKLLLVNEGCSLITFLVAGALIAAWK